MQICLFQNTKAITKNLVQFSPQDKMIIQVLGIFNFNLSTFGWKNYIHVFEIHILSFVLIIKNKLFLIFN